MISLGADLAVFGALASAAAAYYLWLLSSMFSLQLSTLVGASLLVLGGEAAVIWTRDSFASPPPPARPSTTATDLLDLWRP